MLHTRQSAILCFTPHKAPKLGQDSNVSTWTAAAGALRPAPLPPQAHQHGARLEAGLPDANWNLDQMWNTNNASSNGMPVLGGGEVINRSSFPTTFTSKDFSLTASFSSK